MTTLLPVSGSFFLRVLNGVCGVKTLKMSQKRLLTVQGVIRELGIDSDTDREPSDTDDSHVSVQNSSNVDDRSVE